MSKEAIQVNYKDVDPDQVKDVVIMLPDETRAFVGALLAAGERGMIEETTAVAKVTMPDGEFTITVTATPFR